MSLCQIYTLSANTYAMSTVISELITVAAKSQTVFCIHTDLGCDLIIISVLGWTWSVSASKGECQRKPRVFQEVVWWFNSWQPLSVSTVLLEMLLVKRALFCWRSYFPGKMKNQDFDYMWSARIPNTFHQGRGLTPVSYICIFHIGELYSAFSKSNWSFSWIYFIVCYNFYLLLAPWHMNLVTLNFKSISGHK